MANTYVLQNSEVSTGLMSLDDARETGAMALFGEKYGDSVRVLTIGGFSKELCGGTHVRHTGDIGLFKITSEAGIAAGVRRIEAIAGMAAYNYVREIATSLFAVGDRLKASAADVPERLDKLMETLKASEKQVKALEGQLAVAKAQRLLAQVAEADGVKYLAASVTDMGGDALRQAAESLQREVGSGIVSLVSTAGGKVSAVASVSEDLVGRGFKAGDVLSKLMAAVGGKGSGRPNFAQGGGGNPDLVPSAIAGFAQIVRDLAGSVKA
jgi:alanyl-tRNA synthetase